MYPFALLMLFSAVVMALLMQTHHKAEMIQRHRAALDAMYIAVATDAFQMRLARTGGLGTATLEDIAETQEGFKVKGVDPGRLFLVSAANVNDGSWYFDRLLIYSVARDHQVLTGPDEVVLPEYNRCDDTQGFATAPSWCGPGAGMAYTLIETRKIYSAWLAEEALRMEGTLHKLARGYRGKFPSAGLAAGSSQTFCSVGGDEAGSAGCVRAQCSGTRTIDKVPLDCSDLYSLWGRAAVYNVVTNKHVVLAASADNVRVSAAGSTRKIARELRVP